MKTRNRTQPTAPENRALTVAMIITGICCAIFLSVWIIFANTTKNPETTGQDATTTSPTTATVPDPPTTAASPEPLAAPPVNLLEYLPEQVQEAILAKAGEFIGAYSNREFTDPSPTAWLARTVPLTTTAYRQELELTYGQGRGGLAWQEFVTTRASTRADITSVDIIRSDQLAAGKVEVMANYTVLTASETGQILAGPVKYQRIIDLRGSAGDWVVNAFTNLTGDPNG